MSPRLPPRAMVSRNTVAPTETSLRSEKRYLALEKNIPIKGTIGQDPFLGRWDAGPQEVRARSLRQAGSEGESARDADGVWEAAQKQQGHPKAWIAAPWCFPPKSGSGAPRPRRAEQGSWLWAGHVVTATFTLGSLVWAGP